MQPLEEADLDDEPCSELPPLEALCTEDDVDWRQRARTSARVFAPAENVRFTVEVSSKTRAVAGAPCKPCSSENSTEGARRRRTGALHRSYARLA